MTISRRILATLLLAGGLAAAPLRADDGSEAAERAQGVLRRYCVTCHGGKGEPLKADLQILDHNLLLQRKLVHPKDAAASLLLQLVDYGAMPPGDLPKLQPPDVQVLRDWITGGAADFPPNHGDAYVIRQIQNDLLSLDAKKDLPYQRYISFNHLLTDDPAADPTLWRDALLKALNHLSWKPEPVPVTPIDATNTIFRVDERRLGWDVQPFQTPEKTPNRLDLFDLVLLEYPFATVPPRFDGGQKILAEFMRKANPVRPILYVRGDWFVSVATQSPLYEDLLQLPRTLTGPDGLETKILAAGKPARAGYLDSKSSRLPQLVERRTSSGGAYWRTFDVGTARDLKGLLREAASDAERGGLMSFGLPNGFNGYYVAESVPDVGGKRLVRLAPTAPTDWVVDPQAAGQVARNGLSCMRCHESGVVDFTDAVHPALAELAATEREKLAPLFPGKEVMDRFLADDASRFQTAARAAYGGPLEREPLGPVTQRFLKSVLARPFLPGLVVEGPQPLAAATLAASGDVPVHALLHFPRADMDAPPIPPLDALTLPQFQPPLPVVDVDFQSFNLKTKQAATTFQPGDQMTIEVTNKGKRDITIELIASASDERLIVHQPPRKLGPGETYHYPRERPNKPKDFVEMALPPGVDRYILFASDLEFPPGVRLRSEKLKDIGDRVVHPFWEISEDGKEATVRFDPSRLVKKTLAVETR